MKIRQGFVSNSSSSSFILITPSDYSYLDNVEDEDLKELYQACFHGYKDKLGEQEFQIYKGWAETDCGENTISNDSAFNTYCGKKGIYDDAWEIGEKLYFDFPNYFDKDKCLYIGGE